jgi:hypothetical protein
MRPAQSKDLRISPLSVLRCHPERSRRPPFRHCLFPAVILSEAKNPRICFLLISRLQAPKARPIPAWGEVPGQRARSAEGSPLFFHSPEPHTPDDNHPR